MFGTDGVVMQSIHARGELTQLVRTLSVAQVPIRCAEQRNLAHFLLFHGSIGIKVSRASPVRRLGADVQTSVQRI